MKTEDIIGRKVVSIDASKMDRKLIINLSGGVRLTMDVYNCAPCQWTGSEGIHASVRKLPEKKVKT